MNRGAIKQMSATVSVFCCIVVVVVTAVASAVIEDRENKNIHLFPTVIAYLYQKKKYERVCYTFK